MENENKIIAPVENLAEQSTKGIFVSENQIQTWFYQQMAKHQAIFNSNYLTPDDSLATLYNRTRRLSRLFDALKSQWVPGSREIQKACAYYLIHAGLPKEQRDSFAETTANIAHAICHIAAHSDFIEQMQRYFQNQEKELKQLLYSQQQAENLSKTINQ